MVEVTKSSLHSWYKFHVIHLTSCVFTIFYSWVIKIGLSVCVCLAVGLHVVYRMTPAAANPHCSLATEQRLRGEQVQVYTPVGSWLSQTQDLNVGVEIAHQPES